jgi:hypothetical protein
MRARDRIDTELQRFLHTEATDRKCYVADLSTTITSAALNLALEAYRMGADDARLICSIQPRSKRPTVRASAPPDDQSDRPTQPPPGGKRKRSTAPPSRRSR